jgi:hypothetical protein
MEWIVKDKENRKTLDFKEKIKALHFKEKEIANAFVAGNYIETEKHVIRLFNITKVCARIELNP